MLVNQLKFNQIKTETNSVKCKKYLFLRHLYSFVFFFRCSLRETDRYYAVCKKKKSI